MDDVDEQLSFRDGVRKRPGMYVGGFDESGVLHLVRELVDNCLDQHLAGRCRRLAIHSGLRPCVQDDGPGIPAAVIERAFIEPHRTATFDGHRPHVHSGGGGLGLAVIGALTRATIESRDGRGHRRWVLDEGRFTELGIELEPDPERWWSTSITFEADPAIFETLAVRADMMAVTFARLAWLLPGLRVDIDERSHLHPDGIAGWVGELVGQNVPVERLTLERPGTRAELAWAWSPGAGRQQGYVNLMPTRGKSAEVVGFVDGLSGRTGATRRVREDVVAIVNVVSDEPKYASPTREMICDPELAGWIAERVAAVRAP